MLGAPLTWKQPRRVFVCSMTDLFGDWVPREWIVSTFSVMASAPQHQFQVLTKRPRRMAQLLGSVTFPYDVRSFGHLDWPLPNVWLGVSIESDQFSWRAGVLRQIPAAVRF